MDKTSRSSSEIVSSSSSFFQNRFSELKEKSLFSDFLKTESLNIPHALMKFNQEWAASDCCFICSCAFQKRKMLFEHHCRLNGEAVCSNCSKHQVNKERVCDICFLKNLSQEYVKELEHNLKDMDHTIESYKKIMQPIEKEIELIENEKKRKKEMNKEDLSKQNHSLQILKNQVSELDDRHNIALSENTSLKNRLLHIEDSITQISKQWETIRNTNIVLETETTLKKMTLKTREKEYQIAKKRLSLRENDLIQLNQMSDVDGNKERLEEYIKSGNLLAKDNKKCSIF